MSAAALDRSSALPLWAQLEGDLRRRLDNGEFDERFPTDGQLVDSYGVSRHTVREAIRHLNSTGVLTRERGRGTVVNRSRFEQRLGHVYSLFSSIEAAGVEQRSEVLTLETRSADEAAAGHLEIEVGDQVVFLERLRFAGDEPLAVDRAWLPAGRAAPLLDVDFEHTALYDELERLGVDRPDRGWERISPVVPQPVDQARLGMDVGEAAFFLERLGCHDEQPIEWRTTVIRGDRYQFVADWSPGKQGVLTFESQ